MSKTNKKEDSDDEKGRNKRKRISKQKMERNYTIFRKKKKEVHNEKEGKAVDRQF